jgi:hypothetical protein
MESKTDLERMLEDKKKKEEIEKLAINDINMANDGFKFDLGNLDFYLRSSLLDEKLRQEIEKIKGAQGI